MIYWSNFLLSSSCIVYKDGLKARVRKNTNDFNILFFSRDRGESCLMPHLKLQPSEIFVDVGANIGSYTLDSIHRRTQSQMCKFWV